ncbi:MAG: hypothetical protein JW751_08300 [Polyangiaceae bacterium]|nr:hypothetical protein [Polyangiaceae bacterium]
MARRRKRPRVRPGEIEGVVSGAERASLDRLLDLVRAANPTRWSVRDPDERRRGYLLKARLQSRLIALHAAELTAVPTSRSGVVALRLVGRHEDACHAMVADLDAPARAWVAVVTERSRKPRSSGPGAG